MHIVLDHLHLTPTRWRLATHCHGSLAKMEEKIRLHDKILISLTILKNPLPNTLALCLSNSPLSHSKSNIRYLKNMRKRLL